MLQQLQQPHPQQHSYSIRDRQILSQRIGELGPTEHHEIFSIIHQHGIEHTRNKNGVFVNMTLLPNDVIHTINQFVCFCHDNKLNLDEYDKRLNECKFLCTRHDVTLTTPKHKTEQQVVLQHVPATTGTLSTAQGGDKDVGAWGTGTSLPAPPHPPVQPHPPHASVGGVKASIGTPPPTSNQSAFKQAVKRFSRKQRTNDSFPVDYGDAATQGETLTPEPVLIP